VIAQALLRQASKGDVRAIADDCGSSPFERKHRVTYLDSVDADVHSIRTNSQSRSCEVVQGAVRSVLRANPADVAPLLKILCIKWVCHYFFLTTIIAS